LPQATQDLPNLQVLQARERGSRHLPEFTLLEWYRAETNYLDLMEECEEMVAFVLEELGLTPVLEFRVEPGSAKTMAPDDGS